MSALSEVLITAVPGTIALAYPAYGELIGERAGVTNLGTEGSMLLGAMAAISVTLSTGNVWLGVAAAIGAGALAGFAHVVAVVFRNANQLASGLVIWFLVLGITSVLGDPLNGKAVETLPRWPIPGLAELPGIGPALFNQNVLVYLAILLAPAIWLFLARTRPGLVLRATGERPNVVFAAGHYPRAVRALAVTVGGALAGLGGAHFALGVVGNWANNMTNGYGFIAVAVVIFARWNPFGVAAGAYLFGAALAVSSVVQAHGIGINQYLLDALPYLATMIVLVAVSLIGRNNAPESGRDALSGAG